MGGLLSKFKKSKPEPEPEQPGWDTNNGLYKVYVNMAGDKPIWKVAWAIKSEMWNKYEDKIEVTFKGKTTSETVNRNQIYEIENFGRDSVLNDSD